MTANCNAWAQVNNDTSLQSCHPCRLRLVADDYWRFREIIQSRMVYVVYFNLLQINNTHLYSVNKRREDIQFVWARLDYGKSLLTLPMDYIVLSMYLPFIFQDELNLQLQDYPSGCFHFLSDHCQRQLITETLMGFTRVDLDCDGGIRCGTICQQNVSLLPGEIQPEISYHCCQKIRNRNDCSIPEDPSKEIYVFQFLAIILSIIFAASITSWLLSDSLINTVVYRRNDEWHHIRALKLRLLTAQEESTSWRIKRLLNKVFNYCPNHPLNFIIINILSLLCSLLSIWSQLYPYVFQPWSLADHLSIPILGYAAYFTIYTFYTTATFVVLFPFLSLCVSDGQRRLNAIANSSLILNDGQFSLKLLLMKQYQCWKALLSCHCQHVQLVIWNLIKSLILILITLPFTIINEIPMISFIFWKATTLTMTVGEIFKAQCYESSCSQWLFYLYYISALLYVSLSVLGFCLFFQFLSRLILTTIAFVIAYASYFAVYIALVIPFSYLCFKLVHLYSSEKISLSDDIIGLESEVNEELNKLLTADDGQVVVYLAIEDGLVEVDVPECFKCIQQQFRDELIYAVSHQPMKFANGVYKLTVHFVKEEQGSYTVTMSELGEEFDELEETIKSALMERSNQNLQDKIRQVYYQIIDETVDHQRSTHHFSCTRPIGIPCELYHFLSSHSPKITTNLWTLGCRLIFTLILLIAMILGVNEFQYGNSFTAMTATFTGITISSSLVYLIVKYIQRSKLQGEKRKDLIKKYLVDYARGYRFFYQQDCIDESDIVSQ
ncbi:uncharacterized protein TRIADDRAFT_55365 [Trichoplax adhaerens]|uniref:Uncharacterized protein n=1 Tax=Trichoplax adhaerens TaxID=10228 RepID=B3RUP6_TRIAD|nr:predicted protein [Trichoplax adhaerens]EDV25361.1 predicted protein [Trichoplax adhaerens]|eukprot:XP_002111394.1 predicted protein [Trichoplax adhaerens]